MSPALFLSSREEEVVSRMAQGMTNGEIGRDLGLSEDTIKTHARRLFNRIGARGRAHAVAIYLQARSDRSARTMSWDPELAAALTRLIRSTLAGHVDGEASSRVIYRVLSTLQQAASREVAA